MNAKDAMESATSAVLVIEKRSIVVPKTWMTPKVAAAPKRSEAIQTRTRRVVILYQSPRNDLDGFYPSTAGGSRSGRDSRRIPVPEQARCIGTLVDAQQAGEAC